MRFRTDSTHVLAAIRALHRLENVGETMRHALNCLAISAPDWLRQHTDVAWVERYGRRVEQYRLPKEDTQRHVLAATIGQDGYQLLAACLDPSVSVLAQYQFRTGELSDCLSLIRGYQR